MQTGNPMELPYVPITLAPTPYPSIPKSQRMAAANASSVSRKKPSLKNLVLRFYFRR
jgi:hypothetical protein